jgi:hypothetical protein
MLIQLKSNGYFLTLSCGWAKSPRNPSLACTTQSSLPAVCRKINIHPSKLSTTEVGNVLGVSRSIVEKWEVGTRAPKPMTAAAALTRLRSFPSP